MRWPAFLLGQVQQFSIDIQQNVLQPRAWFQEWFVQDDWKITSRLTMNIGTRYTLNFPSKEANDHGAVFNLQTQELQYLGQDGFPHSARQLHWKDFGPRLGISYLLTKKTVVRSGYGLTFFDQAGITTPFTIPQFPFVQTVTQATLDNKTPAFVLADGPSVQPVGPTPDAGLGQGVFSVDRGLGSGYIQQWNLAVQREVTQSLSFEVAYVGSKATHLGVPDVNLNQLTVDQLALGSALTKSVPNPYFGQLPPSSSIGGPTVSQAQLLKPYPRFTNVTLFRDNVGNSDYHAVQAKLEKGFSRGLTFLFSYTRSKLIDDASSVFDASIFTGPIANFPVADGFNRRLEQDVSNGDIPNYFVASWVYELPIGPVTGCTHQACSGNSQMDGRLAESPQWNRAFHWPLHRPRISTRSRDSERSVRTVLVIRRRTIPPPRRISIRQRLRLRRNSLWARARRIRCADPVIKMLIWRSSSARISPNATHWISGRKFLI
jgi:hypothetical protein